MGRAQETQSPFLWQHSQDLNQLLGHVFKVADEHTISFHISFGAFKPRQGDMQYNAIVTAVDKNGQCHTCVTAKAESPTHMIDQVEQFLKRL